MLILTSGPLWVWPLLAVLILVGWCSRQERTIPLAIVYLLPAIGLLTLPALLALPHSVAALAAHALAYAAGAAMGYRLQGRWLLAKGPRHVRLGGESLTLVLMMTMFSAKFVNGTMTAIAPATV